MANTFLRHLALQDSKKGNLHAFKEKGPAATGLPTTQQITRGLFSAQLVLHLYCDKVAGVPQAGNGSIRFSFS